MIPSAPRQSRRSFFYLILAGSALVVAGLYYLTISNFGNSACFGSIVGCYVLGHNVNANFFAGAGLCLAGLATFAISSLIRRKSIPIPGNKRMTTAVGFAAVVLISLSIASFATAGINYSEVQCGIDCALPNGWETLGNAQCSSSSSNCTFPIQGITSHSAAVTSLSITNQTDYGNLVLINTTLDFVVHGNTLSNLTVSLPDHVPSGSVLAYSLILSNGESFTGITTVE